MNKASRLETTSSELSQEVDWLKYKHAERLKVHEIETQYSALSSLFVNTADVAENAIKLKWGDAAKGAVSLLRRPSKPLHFDIDSEAGELNFLVKADREFG